MQGVAEVVEDAGLRCQRLAAVRQLEEEEVDGVGHHLAVHVFIDGVAVEDPVRVWVHGEIDQADEVDGRKVVVLLALFHLSDDAVGGVVEGSFVEEFLGFALHLDEEAGAVGVGHLDVDADATIVWVGVGVLLRSVLDVGDAALGDEFLKEERQQALAGGELGEGAFEPVVKQDVGIDALGLAGDVLDAGGFEAGGLGLAVCLIVLHIVLRNRELVWSGPGANMGRGTTRG